MRRGPVLVTLALAFLLVMGLLYRMAMAPPASVASPIAQPTESALTTKRVKTPPKKTPPPRDRKPRIVSPTGGRATSDLSWGDEGETWSPEAHRIEGQVLGERSRPVAGARITYRTDGKRRTVKSDAEGRFRVTARGKKVVLQAERKDGLLNVRSEPVTIEGEPGEWEVDLVLEAKRHGGLGIGVAKHRDGLRVRSAVDGGPGQKLGLKVGDVILEVGGTTIAGMGIREASDLIIGPEGTEQTIYVRHKEGDEMHYTFRRQVIEKY